MSAAAVEIFCGEALAKIALRGAELKSWAVAGQELIWPGDGNSGANRPRSCFPSLAGPATASSSRAPQAAWPARLCARAIFRGDRASGEPDRPAPRRQSGDARAYPFEFSLYVEYAIKNNSLRISLYEFDETRICPFAWGLHPGFVWPLPGAEGAHVVRFDGQERAEVPVIAPGGLFSDKTRSIPLKGRELALTPELFEEAVCLLDAQSAGLGFFARDEMGGIKPCLRMELDNFPHIALWSRPGAPFLCLEPRPATATRKISTTTFSPNR